MAFGALEACNECQGQLVFKGDAYYCTGDISAWTKCVFKTATPLRKDWIIPKVRPSREPASISRAVDRYSGGDPIHDSRETIQRLNHNSYYLVIKIK